MPNFKLIAPGILLLKTPEVAPFIPLSTDVKRQLIYNAAKLVGKTSGQDKHLFEALYDLAWGDVNTILKNFENCENDAERKKAWLQLLGQVTLASSTGGELETFSEAGELFATGIAATEQLAAYEARAALLKVIAENAPKNNSTIPELKKIIDEIVKRGERPSSFSVVLRLRGPKPGETSFSMPNKPVSEKALDRWRGLLNGGKNSTSVNNINRGGAQTTIGINLDDCNQQTSLSKLLTLISKNHKKILIFAIVGSMIYIVFKKKRSLRKFITSLKKFFKPAFFVYKRIKTNKIINNRLTRGLYVFTRAINRT